MGSGAMIYIPSFIKFGSDILKLIQNLSDNSRCRVLHTSLDQPALSGNVNGLIITQTLIREGHVALETRSSHTWEKHALLPLFGRR
jgi:hypothetical protein